MFPRHVQDYGKYIYVARRAGGGIESIKKALKMKAKDV